MRKILISLILTFALFSTTNADYLTKSINRFINSPSYFEIEFIEDETTRFCEKSYLDAYRQRDFTDYENMICSDFFARKIEDEMNYIRYVLLNRWIY